MKQILQNMSDGATILVETPMPALQKGTIMIASKKSLISAGTERMLVDFGKSSFIAKASHHPDKVKMVLQKVKTDGLLSTFEAVQSKLNQPIALGYCNVGVVCQVSANVSEFKVGDRVISNGNHAEIVKVSKNLCMRIPDVVDDESAAFTVLASIGLQGIRLAKPSLGEAFVVIGAGLIGLLTIQLLKAHGVRVLAIDLDEKKLALAKQFGAEICNSATGENSITKALAFSRGHGVDAVIITAATKSNDPITKAAQMSRKRGRIILVGVTGLELNRADFYEKELTFQVSCSYGPGRYDPSYENKGLDYPIGFVRWTEQRNFEAILDMMAAGQINVKPLISHRFAFENAKSAYDLLTEDKSSLGIMLTYDSTGATRLSREVRLSEKINYSAEKPVIGFIGAGNYASRILIPAFKKARAQLNTIVTSNGISGVIHGKKAGFINASTDTEALLAKRDVNTVVIVTQHNSHAKLVVQALKAHKNVFVEKPLAINMEELAEIEAVYHSMNLDDKKSSLMVGFNRRFSPLVEKMQALLSTVAAPKSFIITVNAGFIPSDHWTQDNKIGGGRIIGECCHFIDLMRFLANSAITSIKAQCINTHGRINNEENAVITLGFKDGSFGSINYLANGNPGFLKERIEVFCEGRILQLLNFRKLQGFGWPKFKKMTLWRQDKGQEQCVARFLQAIEQGSEAPIPFAEILEVSRVTLEVAKILRN